MALRESQSPVIAYIDDDAIARPDWLANIARFFAGAGSDVAAVGGPVEPIWEIPRPRWLHDNLLGYVGVLDWGDKTVEIGPRQSLIGCNVAYRKTAIEAIGAFRTDLGRQGHLLLSNEELDIHERLRAAGQRVFYSPDIQVRHRVPKSRLTPEWMRRRVFWQAISDLMGNPGRLPADSPPRGLFPTEDADDPILFNEECYRIMEAMKELSAGRSVL